MIIVQESRSYPKEKPVPLWEKMTLTLNEAASYSNIGVNKIRELSDEAGCNFVVFVRRKRLIKRKEFEKFIQNCLYL